MKPAYQISTILRTSHDINRKFRKPSVSLSWVFSLPKFLGRIILVSKPCTCINENNWILLGVGVEGEKPVRRCKNRRRKKHIFNLKPPVKLAKTHMLRTAPWNKMWKLDSIHHIKFPNFHYFYFISQKSIKEGILLFFKSLKGIAVNSTLLF